MKPNSEPDNKCKENELAQAHDPGAVASRLTIAE
jgi:hypothetical protein